MKTKRAVKMVSAVQFMPVALFGRDVDEDRQRGADGDPEKLVPVEKRNAGQPRLGGVEKRHPEHGDEGNEDQRDQPAPVFRARLRRFGFRVAHAFVPPAAISSGGGTLIAGAGAVTPPKSGPYS